MIDGLKYARYRVYLGSEYIGWIDCTQEAAEGIVRAGFRLELDNGQRNAA